MLPYSFSVLAYPQTLSDDSDVANKVIIGNGDGTNKVVLHQTVHKPPQSGDDSETILLMQVLAKIGT